MRTINFLGALGIPCLVIFGSLVFYTLFLSRSILTAMDATKIDDLRICPGYERKLAEFWETGLAVGAVKQGSVPDTFQHS